MDVLSNVLWVGGPAGAGKTTVSRALMRRHGLRWYNSDAQTWTHLDRALAAGIPAAQRFDSMTPEERADASLSEIEYDRGPMVMDDLRSLPDSALIIVDGAPPASEVVPDRQAVWLMPSQQAQRARLERRHPHGTPRRYLEGWEAHVGKIEEADYPVVTVDGQTVEETVAEVELIFASRISEGPTARTCPERRGLLRYANDTVVAQYSAFFARHARPSARTTMRQFDCECGDAACLATVELPLSEAAAAVRVPPPTVLADGHAAN